MRPLLMKGHERPLTYLQFNADGDLLVSCAKDLSPTLWHVANGERAGTYTGHNGVVWTCDISKDSKMLITASGDHTVKLWELETGVCYSTFDFDGPARSVSLSEGERLAAVTVDPFISTPPTIHVKRIRKGSEEQEEESVLKIVGPQGRIHRCAWGRLNQTLIAAGEDCVIRMWDAETGKLLRESDPSASHTKAVTSLCKSWDGSHFLTGSLDKTAKLWDIRTLEHLKTYQTDRPTNAVAMSPLLDHIVLGGGQDAAAVTTSSSKAGKFEAKFYHKIFEEEIGGVKGHFGPLNALAFAPDGRGFASGGEDGFVRLHHFDSDYFHIKI